MLKSNFTRTMLKGKAIKKTSNHPPMRRRLISIFSVIIMILTLFSFDVDALLLPIQINDYTSAETIVNLYAPNNGVEYSIIGCKELISPSEGDYAYTLYGLEPYGYVILLNDGLRLMEASYEQGIYSPIDISCEKDYYYVGPWSFLEQDGDELVDVETGDTVPLNSFEELKMSESRARSYEENGSYITINDVSLAHTISAPMGNVTEEDIVFYYVDEERGTDYFDELTYFGDNVSGTCTVLATSILLSYYDIMASDSYVPDHLESGAGTEDLLHLHLNQLVYGTQVPNSNNAGRYIRDIKDKVNEYLDARGITANFESMDVIINTALLTNTVISKIRDEHIPLTLSVATSRGASWDHTVVVYGVSYCPLNELGSAIYYVHTGWHTSKTHPTQPSHALISAGWAYECGYIVCGMPNHDSSMSWGPLNNLYHIASCQCGAKLQQAHTLRIAADGRTYCYKCGWGGDMSTIDSSVGYCECLD